MLAYLAFFPVDALILSRISVGNSSNPPLFAMLLAAVHFLIFVSIVRFYSAVTDRDEAELHLEGREAPLTLGRAASSRLRSALRELK